MTFEGKPAFAANDRANLYMRKRLVAQSPGYCRVQATSDNSVRPKQADELGNWVSAIKQEIRLWTIGKENRTRRYG